MEFRIKRTRGQTWAQLESEDFIDSAFLNEIGELLVESIIYEAAKDFSKQGSTRTPVGDQEGIPGSLGFFNSFKHRVLDQKQQVEIYSTWPWIDQIIEGRRPYPMEWLTQQAGVSRVPMAQPDGTVLIRSTPATGDKAWIHPGFKKHNFVRRGYERARQRMEETLRKQVEKTLRNTSIV